MRNYLWITENQTQSSWRFTANRFVLAPSSMRPTTNIFFQLNTCGYSPYVTSCLTERMGLSFTTAAGPRQRSYSRIWVPRDSWPYFNVSDSRVPNLEGQVPVFMSPRNRGPSYTPGFGFLFVASYDSQGCGGGIRTRLHPVLVEN
jgi:hypothetical protein